MFKMFQVPSALEVAQRDLAEAKRMQLVAHSRLEQAQADLSVQNARVARLEAYVNAHKAADDKASNDDWVATKFPEIG